MKVLLNLVVIVSTAFSTLAAIGLLYTGLRFTFSLSPIISLWTFILFGIMASMSQTFIKMIENEDEEQ